MRTPSRGVLLGVVLALAALAYAGLLFGIADDARPVEQRFGPAAGAPLGVYLEVLSVDALNESAKLRVSLTPTGALRDPTSGFFTRGVDVRVSHRERVERLAMRAGEPSAPVTFDVDLTGTVAAYPLDRFRATLGVSAQADGAALPVALTVWEGIPGWKLSARGGAEGSAAAFVLTLRRGAGTVLLVLALYLEMALIALAALAIGCLVFLRRKPAESTLVGALTGMIFALPALRYALPGSPPFGVRADLFVFFWAELAVALSLALFVSVWARAPTAPKA